MSRPRPAKVRFYVDQDLRGAGIVLGALNPEVTYPDDAGADIHNQRRRPCEIPVGTADVDWLPVVGRHRWLALSRDSNIQKSISELTAVRDHDVKLVCLTGESAVNKWSQLQCIFKYWPDLEKLSERDGPFVFKLSGPSGLREVDVDLALSRLRRSRRPGS